jgi:hypothetical protein
LFLNEFDNKKKSQKESTNSKSSAASSTKASSTDLSKQAGQSTRKPIILIGSNKKNNKDKSNSSKETKTNKESRADKASFLKLIQEGENDNNDILNLSNVSITPEELKTNKKKKDRSLFRDSTKKNASSNGSKARTSKEPDEESSKDVDYSPLSSDEEFEEEFATDDEFSDGEDSFSRKKREKKFKSTVMDDGDEELYLKRLKNLEKEVFCNFCPEIKT